jgi:nitroreductase
MARRQLNGERSAVETWKAVNSVRVVRKFSEEPITDEHLERILNAARRTGSSKNDQDWAFIVIRDRDHLAQLAEVGDYAGHLAGATVAIAIVTPDATDHLWDSGRAAQNMVLAAWDLGIGSAPATVYDHALAARLLGLPEDRRCDYLLSFGHPADPAQLTAPNRAGGRLPLSELVHEERW